MRTFFIFLLSVVSACAQVKQTGWTTNSNPTTARTALGAFATAGGTFTGSITDRFGFYGDAVGLTNQVFSLITDFGAIGTSDDTTVFQAAFYSGKPLIIPPGKYIVSNLQLTNNIRVLGYGSAISMKSGSTGYLLDQGLGNTNVWLEGFTLDGGSYNQNWQSNSANRNGLRALTQSGNSALVNINCTGFEGQGFYFDGTTNLNNTYKELPIVLSGLKSVSCYYGFYTISLSSSIDAEYINFDNCVGMRCMVAFGIFSGNVQATGGEATGNNIGVTSGGGNNPAHGIFTSVTLNHNQAPIALFGFNNGFIFNSCNILGGGGVLLSNVSGVEISGGYFDPDTVANVNVNIVGTNTVHDFKYSGAPALTLTGNNNFDWWNGSRYDGAEAINPRFNPTNTVLWAQTSGQGLSLSNSTPLTLKSNTAPSGLVTPLVWFSWTNASDGLIYRTPGYQ